MWCTDKMNNKIKLVDTLHTAYEFSETSVCMYTWGQIVVSVGIQRFSTLITYGIKLKY